LNDDAETVKAPRTAWWQHVGVAVVWQIAWAFAIWWFFIVGILLERYHLSLGLGAAVYPVFFTIPVVLFALLYGRSARNWLRNTHASRATWLIVFWLAPTLVTAIGLLVFCPRD
jgi:hypothetical protein